MWWKLKCQFCTHLQSWPLWQTLAHSVQQHRDSSRPQVRHSKISCKQTSSVNHIIHYNTLNTLFPMLITLKTHNQLVCEKVILKAVAFVPGWCVLLQSRWSCKCRYNTGRRGESHQDWCLKDRSSPWTPTLHPLSLQDRVHLNKNTRSLGSPDVLKHASNLVDLHPCTYLWLFFVLLLKQ